MTSRSPLILCFLLLIAPGLGRAADAARELRVCADPDNLPFSNDRLEGFENKIAQLVADDLQMTLRNSWFHQSGASIGQALNAGTCDLIVGAPAGWGPVLTTKPYYSSTYVFVYPTDKHASISSFDDPALSKCKIGLPLISGGGANPPPAYALARRGLEGNVIGFPAIEPGKIIDAVASGDIDTAVVWGPLGGYFARREPIRLSVTPVSDSDEGPYLRFTYDISMGVKRGNTELKDQLERVLERRQKEIRKVLEEYGVPVVSPARGGSMSAKSIH